MDVLRGIDLEQVEQSKGNKMYESTMLKIAREEKRKRGNTGQPYADS